MRFDDEGIFWVPELYKSAKGKARAEKGVPQPRNIPPIPDTGWRPRALFPDLSAARAIAVDTETFDPDLRTLGPGARRDGFIVGVSIAADDFCAYYPVAHSFNAHENLDPVPVFAWLREQLGRPHQAKVGANLLYDLDFLDAAGIAVAGPLYDTLYADPLIYEYESSYSLESVAQRRLGENKDTSLLYQWCAEAYGGEVNADQRANIWRAPPSLVGPYAEQDARLPLRTLREQWRILQERGMVPILEMECRLIPLLLQMRKHGCRINLARRQEIDDELTLKIDALQQELGLNVYVPTQIQALCDEHGIEYPFTKTGKPSFTKGWLKKHAHPKLRSVSQLRGFYKLRDTFLRGSMLASQREGRVHCEFHPLRSDDYGTVSGRFSASHPNLQQIPARDPYWGPRLRSCFIPEPEHIWMKIDLSQIEFRLGVHYAVGDKAEEVREEYRRNLATDFYNLAVSYTGLERFDAKTLSLGSLYGMGLPKFAKTIDKSTDAAREVFNQYHERLPFLRATYQAAAREAKEHGFVRTVGGRVCNLTEGFEHKALNRRLQGSCADWIKKSMLDAYEAGLFDVLELLLTVHDELDCSVPRNAQGVEAARELHHIMTTAYTLNIPVLAGIDLGPSWGEGVECTAEEVQRIVLGESPL